jgi:hypothetical protein
LGIWLSGRVLASLVWGTGFDPQHTEGKKKEEGGGVEKIREGKENYQ